MAKLSERDLVCVEVLVRNGRSVHGEKELRLDESTLRYRLRRRAAVAVNRRAQQAEVCAPETHVVEAWIEEQG